MRAAFKQCAWIKSWNLHCHFELYVFLQFLNITSLCAYVGKIHLSNNGKNFRPFFYELKWESWRKWIAIWACDWILLFLFYAWIIWIATTTNEKCFCFTFEFATWKEWNKRNSKILVEFLTYNTTENLFNSVQHKAMNNVEYCANGLTFTERLQRHIIWELIHFCFDIW